MQRLAHFRSRFISLASSTPPRAVSFLRSSSAGRSRVPDLEVSAARRSRAIASPIGTNRRGDGPFPLRGREPEVAAGDLEARRETLDVPLDRPGQRLVEVVQPEDQLALGCREQPEVHQVRVTAELRREPRHGRRRQVGGHDRGRASVEGERRGGHPPVAKRHEIGHPRRRLLLEDGDRVGALLLRGFHSACRSSGTFLRSFPPMWRAATDVGGKYSVSGNSLRMSHDTARRQPC